MPNVNAQHIEYTENIESWTTIRDCIKGQKAIKLAGEVYLPNPDKSDEERYKSYKQRALFSNMTKRTLITINSAIYKKKATIELPTTLEYLERDSDGKATNLIQKTKSLSADVISYGRAGILVEYSTKQQATTLKEQKALNGRAKITSYSPFSIINWREDDGKVVKIVLKEEYIKSDDGFDVEYGVQNRVLILEDGVYRQDIYREESFHETIEIKDFNGRALNFIPFYFIGAENNDYTVDESIISDIADINISHYLSSADNSESEFICGQPTVAFSTSYDVQDFNTANPSGKIVIGSRAAYNLGEGGSLSLVQADPNNMARQAMKDKEEMAVMLGAKIVVKNNTVKTIQQAEMDNSAELSIIENVALNISNAMTDALIACSYFLQAKPLTEDDITFELNTELFSEMADHNLLRLAMDMSDRGIIAIEDIYNLLVRAGLIYADRTLEDIQDDISQQPPIGTIEETEE